MIGIDVMRLSRQPTPSPTVEVTPEQEQPVVSSEPVEAEPVAEPPRAEGEQEASA
jgi:hypothetical protein